MLSQDFFKKNIIKYLFVVLGYVKYYVKEKFDFENCDLQEVYELTRHLYRMKFNSKYRMEKYPDLTLNELLAVVLYKLGIPNGVSIFVDDVTLTYGYGYLDGIGCWQFEIPPQFLKSGTTLESYPVLDCDLESKIEGIRFHAYKVVKA